MKGSQGEEKKSHIKMQCDGCIMEGKKIEMRRKYTTDIALSLSLIFGFLFLMHSFFFLLVCLFWIIERKNKTPKAGEGGGKDQKEKLSRIPHETILNLCIKLACMYVCFNLHL